MNAPPSAGKGTQAFSYVGFRYFWLTTLCVGFAWQIVAVSVAWLIYDVTGNAFLLGLVGLCLFAPSLVLILVTGLVADRIDRRLVMRLGLLANLAGVAGLLVLVSGEVSEVWPVFVILTGLGAARAFWSPAARSMTPNLVPAEALANAVTINSSAHQFAAIAGPAAGGLLYGVGPTFAFGAAAALLGAAFVFIALIPRLARREAAPAASLEILFAGFRYIFSNRVVLGAVSLDMFAVMAGGAVALLPIYAKDILNAGPEELGLLRAGPGIGAILMAFCLMRFPVRDHAGRLLFIFVGLYGLFTVVFGLSSTVWLSVLALALVGAADMVSVAIRETIIQLWTPEAVRGRVNAVNGVFIGASNELGEFRAGTVAYFLGPVPAVVLGGVVAMAIAGGWAKMFPELRNQRRIDRRMA